MLLLHLEFKGCHVAFQPSSLRQFQSAAGCCQTAPCSCQRESFHEEGGRPPVQPAMPFSQLSEAGKPWFLVTRPKRPACKPSCWKEPLYWEEMRLVGVGAEHQGGFYPKLPASPSFLSLLPASVPSLVCSEQGGLGSLLPGSLSWLLHMICCNLGLA